MTIPLLEVSFNNIFEYGQGYVALSRATCLEGLTLRSFQVQNCVHARRDITLDIDAARAVPCSASAQCSVFLCGPART
jgi:hypothetical protein